jgi:hypothetical protein
MQMILEFSFCCDGHDSHCQKSEKREIKTPKEQKNTSPMASKTIN